MDLDRWKQYSWRQWRPAWCLRLARRRRRRKRARGSYSSIDWTDRTGNLWLFGGGVSILAEGMAN